MKPADKFRPPHMVGARRSGPHPIKQGLMVEFEMVAGHLTVYWLPDLPRTKLSPTALRRYREHRGRFLERIAQEIGERILLAEL
jgi:hypothetical protein